MVFNISKEGRALGDIYGRIISEEDAGAIYSLVAKINKEGGTKGDRIPNIQNARGMVAG